MRVRHLSLCQRRRSEHQSSPVSPQELYLRKFAHVRAMLSSIKNSEERVCGRSNKGRDSLETTITGVSHAHKNQADNKNGSSVPSMLETEEVGMVATWRLPFPSALSTHSQ